VSDVTVKPEPFAVAPRSGQRTGGPEIRGHFVPGDHHDLPVSGALTLFGAGSEYVRGITRVTRGPRDTYAGWFTYEKANEDPNAPRVF